MLKTLGMLVLSLILSAQAASAATDDVKEMGSEAMEKVEGAAEDVKDLAGDVAEKAQEAAGDVKDFSKEVLDKAEEGAEEAKDSTKRMMRGPKGEKPATAPAISEEEWKATLEQRQAAMTPEQKAKVEKLAADLAGGADAATLQASIIALGSEEKKPAEKPANMLATDLQQALAGKTVTTEDGARLAQNIDVMVNKEGVARGQMRAASADVKAVLSAHEVDEKAIKKINMDLMILSRGGDAASKPAMKAGKNRMKKADQPEAE